MKTTHGLTALHIFFPLGCGKGQLRVRIQKCDLNSCIQPIKTLAHILFRLYHIGYMNVSSIISTLSLLHWKRASLKILVMLTTDVQFSLIFMLALNDAFPWYPPIKMLIYIIDSLLFVSLHIRQDSSNVRRQSACLYHKLICFFYEPLSFSYSFVPYYASI